MDKSLAWRFAASLSRTSIVSPSPFKLINCKKINSLKNSSNKRLMEVELKQISIDMEEIITESDDQLGMLNTNN